MNRDDLIREAAAHSEEPLGIVEQVLDATLTAIAGALNEGRAVKIDGFGTFHMRYAEARPGQRADGETITHPPFRQPTFRAAKEWRKRLNTQSEDAA